LNDVKATIALFEKLISKFRELDDLHKNLLYYVFSKSNDLNVVFLRDFLFSLFKVDKLTLEKFEKYILKIV